jgi:hypothetical protein
MKAIAILMSFALYLVAAAAHSADSPMMEAEAQRGQVEVEPRSGEKQHRCV